MYKRVYFIIVFIIIGILLIGCNPDKNFTVSFNSNGGSIVLPITVQSNQTIPLEEPTKEGHTFDGWYTGFSANDVRFTNITAVTKDLTLYAKWTINEYEINFETNGATLISPVKVKYSDKISTPDNPIKEGFFLEGWYTNSELTTLYDFSTNVVNSFTLYAKWDLNLFNLIENVEIKNNNISFDLNTTNLNIELTNLEVSIFSNESVIETINNNLNFNGQSPINFNELNKNTSYKIKIMASFITNDIVHTFEVIEEYSFKTSNCYNVLTNLNGGTLNHGETGFSFNLSDDISKLPLASKFGYDFDGWFNSNNEKIISTEQLYDNIVLTAKWSMKPVTIKFRVPSGVVSAALPNLINNFKTLYPNINIQLDCVTGGYTELRRLTILDIQANQAPDLVIGYPDHLAEYYASGALINLQFLIDNNEYGYLNNELDDFIQGFLIENRGFNQQKPNDLYGLPFNKSTEVLVYNKTVIDALNAFDPGVFVPTTWEEVSSVSEKIISLVQQGYADNIIPLYHGQKKPSQLLNDGQFIPFSYDSPSNAFITMSRQWGGEYTQKISNEKGFIKFNNAQVIAGLTHFQNEALAGRYAVSETFGSSYTSDAFKMLKTIMYVGSSAGVGYSIPEGGKFEVAVAKAPYLQANPDNKFVIHQGTNICMLNQNSEAKQLASWMFIKFLLEPENTAIFAMATGGYFPVRHSAYETNLYKAYLTNPPIDKINHSKAANVAISYLNDGYSLFIDPPFIRSSLIHNEVGCAYNSIIVNKRNIQDTIQKAYDNLYAFIEHEVLDSPNYEDEIQSIYLIDLTSITSSFELPAKTIKNVPIIWELICDDGSAQILLANDKIILTITRKDVWGYARLKASITIDNQTQERYWDVFIKKIDAIDVITCAEAKASPLNEKISIIATVSYVTTFGIMIHDATGGFYVYTGSAPAANVLPGAEVKVTGTRALYYSMPQLASPTIEVLTLALASGYDYSMAPAVTSTDLNAYSPNNVANYAKMVQVSGLVVKVPNYGAYPEYEIKDISTGETIYIYNSSTAAVKAELNDKVGQHITMVVITYDYHSTQKIWRNLGVQGTITVVPLA